MEFLYINMPANTCFCFILVIVAIDHSKGMKQLIMNFICFPWTWIIYFLIFQSPVFSLKKCLFCFFLLLSFCYLIHLVLFIHHLVMMWKYVLPVNRPLLPWYDHHFPHLLGGDPNSFCRCLEAQVFYCNSWSTVIGSMNTLEDVTLPSCSAGDDKAMMMVWGSSRLHLNMLRRPCCPGN